MINMYFRRKSTYVQSLVIFHFRLVRLSNKKGPYFWKVMSWYLFLCILECLNNISYKNCRSKTVLCKLIRSVLKIKGHSNNNVLRIYVGSHLCCCNFYSIFFSWQPICYIKYYITRFISKGRKWPAVEKSKRSCNIS